MAARESIAEIKQRAGRVARALAKLYPNARISLDFETPWQCLAATILSAQSTDAGVNRVTPRLFKEYPDARAMAAADPRRVEELIVRTGFFRQKTRSLMGAARKIVEDYGGEVPSAMDALVKIPGVGRKTANVILGHIFGKPGFVVDTHVRRLTYRLGFTRNTDPEKIEIDDAEDPAGGGLDAVLDAADFARAADLYRAEAAMRDLCDRGRLSAGWGGEGC